MAEQSQGSSVPSPGVPVKMKVGVPLATLVLPLVGLLAGFLYMRSDDPEKRKAGRPWLFLAIGVFLVYGAGFCKAIVPSQTASGGGGGGVTSIASAAPMTGLPTFLH